MFEALPILSFTRIKLWIYVVKIKNEICRKIPNIKV